MTFHSTRIPHNVSGAAAASSSGGTSGKGVRRLGLWDSIKNTFSSVGDSLRNVFTNLGQAIKIAFTGDGELDTEKTAFKIKWNFDPAKLPDNAKFLKYTKASFDADVGYTIRVEVEDYKLKYFLAETNGIATNNFSPASLAMEKQYGPMWFPFVDVPMFDTVIMVGPVPLVIGLDLVVEFDITANAKAGVNVEIQGQGHFRFGQEYKNGKWSPVNDHTMKYSLVDAEAKASATLDIGLAIAPKLTFEGVASFQVPIRAGVEMTATVDLLDTCGLRLDVTPSVTIGLEFLVSLNFWGSMLEMKRWGPLKLWEQAFLTSTLGSGVVILRTLLLEKGELSPVGDAGAL
eukprot:g1305.t1